MGLGLDNQIAISTRGGNNLAGVENGHNTCIGVCTDDWDCLCFHRSV